MKEYNVEAYCKINPTIQINAQNGGTIEKFCLFYLSLSSLVTIHLAVLAALKHTIFTLVACRHFFFRLLNKATTSMAFGYALILRASLNQC